MKCCQVPVVEPTPTTAVIDPAGTIIVDGPVEMRPAALAFTVGAVVNAVKIPRTVVPAVALASEAVAPVMVCVVPPRVPEDEY